MSDPNAPQPVQPRYTGGQIAMLVIGGIMLIPGACSLLFMPIMAPELGRGNPYVGAFVGLWVLCFFISVPGIALIYVARKDARAAANKPDRAGNPPP